MPANLQFRYRSVLNDEDAGRFLGFDTTLQDEVIAGQALPQLSVDAQGNIAVIWYDTRRDPSNHRLDVYGTFSSDAGVTFSGNSRVTSSNFDANTGAFTDARNTQSYFLGDRIGLAMADGTAYAAWTGTDTRAGNQDVFFSSFSLRPTPAAFNDRFEANDTATAATNLGTVTVQRVVPRLSLGQGDQDWFRVQAGATGRLIIAASAAAPTDALRLELWDSTAATRLASGLALIQNGLVVGQQIQFQSVTGQTYLVRATGPVPSYFLSVQSLTADLGTRVQASVDGTLAAGGADVYRLVTGVGGSLQIALTSGTSVQGNLNVQLLSANGQTILAQGTEPGCPGPGEVERIDLAVNQGQVVLVKVLGTTTASVLLNGTAVTLGLGTPGPATTFSVPAAVNGVRSINLQVDGVNPVNIKVTKKNSSGTVLATQNIQLTPGTPVTVTFSSSGSYDLQATDPVGSGGYQLDITNLDVFQSSSSNLFFPAGGSSSAVVTGDVNRDGRLDLILSSTQGGDQVRVLLGNADGTFQAPRQFDVGSGQAAISAREVVLADFTSDGIPDLVVPNYFSADISLLPGRGDGTFAPQRRFNAVYRANSVAAGDWNGDGAMDLAVVDRKPGPATVAILLGRGDGTFQPPRYLDIPFARGDASPIRSGELNGDGKTDLVVFSLNDGTFQVLLGRGNGNFDLGGTFATGEVTFEGQLADLNGDGKIDVIAGGGNSGSVIVLLGNGNGTFQNAQVYGTAPRIGSDNVVVVGLALADYGGAGGGAADGRNDVIVTTRYRSGSDVPAAYFLPGIVPDSNGRILGAAVKLGTANEAGKVALGDFDRDGAQDLAISESGGVRVLYHQRAALPANTTPETARDLGTVVHLVIPTLAISPKFTDAYFKLTVPTEAARGAGEQVLDFSALFQYTQGGGLAMEVTGGRNVPHPGAQFRIIAAQGAQLTLHVFGIEGADGTLGAGVYTLDIDVLPQVVFSTVQAESPVPGGPVTSIVLTLQGDRLDLDAASNPANYTVVRLGQGSATLNQVVPLASVPGAQPVIYNPGANVEVVSGLYYATAVRQTVTLLFSRPLLPGSYAIALSPNITTAAFSAGEDSLLAETDHLGGHGIVSLENGTITNGAYLVYPGLVRTFGTPGNLSLFTQGTPFLTQMANDLCALLDQVLAAHGGDSASITAALNAATLARFAAFYAMGGIITASPIGARESGNVVTITMSAAHNLVVGQKVVIAGVGVTGYNGTWTVATTPSPTTFTYYNPISGLASSGGGRVALSTFFTILWLDPVSLTVQAPQGQSASYNLQTNQVTNNLSQTYVNVSGNVEVVVMANAAGTFNLDVGHIPQTARGGLVTLDAAGQHVSSLTDALRSGTGGLVMSIAAMAVPPASNASSGSASPANTTAMQTAALQAMSALMATMFTTGLPGAISETTTAPTANEGTSTSVFPSSAAGQGSPAVVVGYSTDETEPQGIMIDDLFRNWTVSIDKLIDAVNATLEATEKAVESLGQRIRSLIQGGKPDAPPDTPDARLILPPKLDSGEVEWLWAREDLFDALPQPALEALLPPRVRGEERAGPTGDGNRADVVPAKRSPWDTDESWRGLFLAASVCVAGLPELAASRATFRQRSRNEKE